MGYRKPTSLVSAKLNFVRQSIFVDFVSVYIYLLFCYYNVCLTHLPGWPI